MTLFAGSSSGNTALGPRPCTQRWSNAQAGAAIPATPVELGRAEGSNLRTGGDWLTTSLTNRLHLRRRWPHSRKAEEIQRVSHSFVPRPYDPVGFEVSARLNSESSGQAKIPPTDSGIPSGSPPPLTSIPRGWPLAAAGAIEVAGLSGWELLDKFSQVDQHVYDTMERLSKETIARSRISPRR
jgi:hypothetical protein